MKETQNLECRMSDALRRAVRSGVVNEAIGRQLAELTDDKQLQRSLLKRGAHVVVAFVSSGLRQRNLF